MTLKSSRWGNPFVIGRDGTRAEVIRKYKAWVVRQPELMASLHELKGKRLGCWCGGKACHGDVLVELADALPEPLGYNEPEQGSIFEE
jgi:hypothetical protein